MLRAIQPDLYQKLIRQQLQDIKHNLKLLDHVSTELSALSSKKRDGGKEVLMQRGEMLRVELKDKLKGIQVNVGQVVAMLDLKLSIVIKQLTKLQKQQKQPLQAQQPLPPQRSKQQQALKQQITQLQQRIFQLQKRQNQHVKQLSTLKQRNAKLRQQFNNLSFDSNQRIKELSEKLHNNTSPNLTIKKNVVSSPIKKVEASYSLNGDDDFSSQRKNNRVPGQNNVFVKIKGNIQQGVGLIEHGNVLDMSQTHRNDNNLLDSFTSQSSDYDPKPYPDGIPSSDPHSNGNKLMLGCFPGKQISQKTKTGSSSQNKKLKFVQSCEKSHRFQFLLNNLIDDKSQEGENRVEKIGVEYDGMGQSGYGGNGGFSSGQNLHKQLVGYQLQQQQVGRSPISNNRMSPLVLQQQVKRYQI